MTLGLLVVNITIAALLLTALTALFSRRVENYLVTYLQHFTGALFVFSGSVKAIDPLGTAYKMQDYFGAFEGTFEPTWFSFLAPLFAALNDYAVAFSVLVIVFEIVLGIMLILGAARRFTSWAFLVLVAFFTLLTGFTYLTGYVPSGVNFFQFGQWGPFVDTNMKVTDCGCFGDFLKLEPKVSFLKDLALLVPGILFVFLWPSMHQLFTRPVRGVIIGLSSLGLIIYCLSNFVWDIPDIDFRAFREGVNVREQKAAEAEAQANIEVIGYRLTEKEGNRVVEMPLNQYLAEFKEYPKEDWEIEQIQSQPALEPTKISDFIIRDVDEHDVTEEILGYSGYSLMIVAYTLKGTPEPETITLSDTTWRYDTLVQGDSIVVERSVDSIATRQVQGEVYTWPDSYLRPWTEIVNPVLEDARAADVRTYAVAGGATREKIDDFRHATQSAYTFYTADDILLKTIVRSNPGIVLWHDGEIIAKWHINKLPSFPEIEAAYLGAR